jgi:hypothetical protein
VGQITPRDRLLGGSTKGCAAGPILHMAFGKVAGNVSVALGVIGLAAATVMLVDPMTHEYPRRVRRPALRQ